MYMQGEVGAQGLIKTLPKAEIRPEPGKLKVKQPGILVCGSRSIINGS